MSEYSKTYDANDLTPEDLQPGMAPGERNTIAALLIMGVLAGGAVIGALTWAAEHGFDPEEVAEALRALAGGN
jgi:hypothetical protein